MKREILYKNFLDTLYERYPQRSQLASILTDMLCLEKEAVYRRLRKEVPFTFHEVAVISQQMKISMNNVISSSKEISMHMKFADFVSPTEVDILLFQKLIDIFKESVGKDYVEYGVATNILPHSIFFFLDGMTRYFIFKWKYQYCEGKAKKFSEIILSDEMEKIKEEYAECMTKMKRAFYIFDNNIFKFIIDDLKYFLSIKLITQNEVDELKRELHMLLDRMDDIAAKGYYRYPENKVFFYISQMNFNSSYTYLDSPLYQLSITQAFTMNGFASLDHDALAKHKSMIHSLRKSSVLISESGEWERVSFIEKQREIIDTV
ncbi:MAG: hypothetical protein LIO79_09395 [Rikenellaceae bacterium]|nr:hypothetical protein [Rikenellaceae bacterium]